VAAMQTKLDLCGPGLNLGLLETGILGLATEAATTAHWRGVIAQHYAAGLVEDRVLSRRVARHLDPPRGLVRQARVRGPWAIPISANARRAYRSASSRDPDSIVIVQLT
jgi:hypothetical protein